MTILRAEQLVKMKRETILHLYDRVQEHDPRFLGDDLLSCVMMLYELWDGGKASAFKSVLILQTKRGKLNHTV